MDIFLDSNVYLTDIKLESARFANFFDYVRRTRSKLVLPWLVRDEVVQKHREKLTLHAARVEKELKDLRRYAMDQLVFHGPYIKGESNDLKALLRKPSKGVRSHFVASMDGIDLKEVVRRGINRMPPASHDGEELRDVVLWLLVLRHAKTATQPTAFVTADTGFWDDGAPKPQMLADIRREKVDVRLYRDLGEFTRDNALVSAAVTADWAHSHTEQNELQTAMVNSLRDFLNEGRRIRGKVSNVTVAGIRFVEGTLYKIDDRTDFAELWYDGSFVVESAFVRYPSVLEDTALGKFAHLGSGFAGIGTLMPMSAVLEPHKSREKEVLTTTFDVDADFRVSSRYGPSNELEVD